jgi:hypothetical protein
MEQSQWEIDLKESLILSAKKRTPDISRSPALFVRAIWKIAVLAGVVQVGTSVNQILPEFSVSITIPDIFERLFEDIA